MEGPIPNPATLDVDGDDDVPLSLVKEKQTIDRNESIRKTSVGQQSAPRNVSGPQADLIGGIDTPPRASTAGPPATNKVPPKAEPAPPKSTSTKESLLGLDFLGEPSAPPRPASTTGVSAPSGQSRPDLKQSILSLYASAPRQPPQQPQQPQQPAQHQQQGSFGSFGGSPTIGHHQQGSAGGFSDAFSSLSLGNTTSPKPAATDPFASLGGSSGTRRPAQPANNNSFGGLGSGSFFNSKPAQPVAPAHQKQPSSGGFGDFGDFSSPTSPPISQSKPPQPSSSAMGDLFDLSSPAPTTQTISSPPPMASPPASSSVFNLSAPQNPPAQAQQQRPAQATTAVPSAFGGSGISGADVWGGSAWATPDTTTAAAPAANNSAPAQAAPANDFGWGSSGGFGTPAPAPVAAPAPKVAADEEFGGWTSSTGGQSTSTGSKPVGGGFGGDEDLFSNVWG
jgi:stromal membrane-associated protein